MQLTPHFRNARWGMSKTEVLQSESADLLFEDTTALLFSGTLFGSECSIYYTFREDRLVEAMYAIDNTNDVHDVVDFLQVKQWLTEEMGEPSKAKEHAVIRAVENPLLGQTARACAQGETQLRAVWMLPETLVDLACTRDESDPNNAKVYLNYICLSPS